MRDSSGRYIFQDYKNCTFSLPAPMTMAGIEKPDYKKWTGVAVDEAPGDMVDSLRHVVDAAILWNVDWEEKSKMTLYEVFVINRIKNEIISSDFVVAENREIAERKFLVGLASVFTEGDDALGVEDVKVIIRSIGSWEPVERKDES